MLPESILRISTQIRGVNAINSGYNYVSGKYKRSYIPINN